MRLIDADALKLADFQDFSDADVFAAIDAQPAVDAVQVVHGHWIWHEDSFEYECSACKCRFDYNHTFELFDHGYQYANYCPNCGAQMGADVEWTKNE